MFIKISALLLFGHILFVQAEKLNWDLAVVVGNQLKLLSANGSVVEERSQPFTSLKALVYDGVRDQFIVSDTDMDLKNDTIYTVQFTKETDITVPIIQGLPGDVQGLAIDPVDDVLYWTDAINHTINYVLMAGTTEYGSNEFLLFNDKRPHAIAIDICNRYIYYTNPSGERPSIERMKLDKTGHEVLVNNTIMTPVGLAIDYKNQRLYWADSRIGSSAGRIESITLDGKDRRLMVERISMEPYALAVNDDAIYWTDTNNNVLYKFLKSNKNAYADPEKIATFSEIPMGLVANENMYNTDCGKLDEIIKENEQRNLEMELEKESDSECLNDGTPNGSRCDCKAGFRGAKCEISKCDDDYCLNGNCALSSMGRPVCTCHNGFIGQRCQKNVCDGYCLNEGKCSPTSMPRSSPKCTCLDGFFGDRCQYDQEICNMTCRDKEDPNDEFYIMCRCDYLYPEKNKSIALASTMDNHEAILKVLKDPVIYLSGLLCFCLGTIVALILYVRVIKKRRPRIKKRIIVNKNVTPLTYRPQQPTTEQQCEITIENCCNMNVCETPCFEPTREDKKKLLTNMEGEDIY